ncbi:MULTISPECIES: ABC transporter ATP-binding protein/permease [Micrococcaceae]|uniref:ABC transporter ATP-binding protein/permease n=1 Tax=Micrococcaceae TaxID=1268 RepID=UPI00105F6D9A|nr:ABC transporter ATP-binding protein [Arthrobacter sp. JUb115]TDU20581.1 ATP-binding cassette subfamily C protein CydD [Arthrobacter sp. JUb115]
MRRVFGIFSAATAIVVALSLSAAAGTAGLVIVVGQGLDELMAHRPLGTQWYASAFGELLIMAVATFLIPVVISRNSLDLTEYHRMKLLKHYLSIGPLAVRASGDGELLHAAMDSVERSVKYRSSFIGPAISAVATPVLILCFIAFAIDPLSALVLLVPTALVPVIVLGFQRRFGSSNGEYRRAQGILSATFLDALRSLGMLKLNGGSRWMGSRIEQATERVRQQVMKLLARNQLILLVIDSSFAVLLLASAALLAWWRASSGAITPGSALSLVILSFLMLAPVNYVGSFFYIGMTGKAAEKKLAEVADIPMHRSMANPLHVDLRHRDLILEEVSASYDSGHHALDKISWHFPAGSRTAIIGPSGSGKTTLLRVLQGQLEASSGTIRDARQAMGPATLKANTAVVEQHATLFGMSLRENLLLGAPRAADGELLVALRQVGMGAWFEAQPGGLAQRLGEGGARLSGGQAQRLSLARALLAQRPVLLLDEPTSALDVQTEADVLGTLRSLDRSTTVITVTHRLGLLADYDYVLVMDHGQLIQAGRRDELLAADGYLKEAMDGFRQRADALHASGRSQLGEGN